MASSRNSDFPDGLHAGHVAPRGGPIGRAAVLPILVLGLLMAVAMAGLLGGAKSDPVISRGKAATLTVTMPQTMRSGLVFETRILVRAHRDLADAIIALPPSLWQDQTINTAIPAADSEDFKDGRFRYHFGEVKAGDQLAIKFDGQINPPLTIGVGGSIALYDRDAPVASVPLRIRVLP